MDKKIDSERHSTVEYLSEFILYKGYRKQKRFAICFILRLYIYTYIYKQTYWQVG